ncbi:MAG: hypothetical protein GXP10_03075 [Gammaproteobacteria bacterium]|nr:hypothetical protein [Gammaproteobacteria bacterium]
MLPKARTSHPKKWLLGLLLLPVLPGAVGAALTPDQGFKISITVKNQSAANPAGPTLHYYESTDSALSTEEKLQKIGLVTTLTAGGISPESLVVSALQSTATYQMGACAAAPDTNSTCSTRLQVTVSRTYPLIVSKAGGGSGTITSNPAGIACGVDCAADYLSGATVTLIARVDAGSIFTGWSGGGCNGAGRCQLTMDASTSVLATFEANIDTDGDNILNYLDPDDDNDGVPDNLDSRPLNAAYRGSAIGRKGADEKWKRVNLNGRFDQPVAILGPPSFKDNQPGVMRLRNVGGSNFEIRFQEWNYLDGIHATEKAPLLLLEEGIKTMPDGSIWEVGRFNVNGTAKWQWNGFQANFPEAPRLFLTLQTYNSNQAVTVRAKAIKTNGFKAALFEQQSLMNAHPTETVGYLAIHSPTGSGRVNINGEELPYVLQQQNVNHLWTPILSSALKAEEEESQDDEVTHAEEALDILGLGKQLFAQDVSTRRKDTIALRQQPVITWGPLEWGAINSVTEQWVTIPLGKSYKNPVVVARTGRQNDSTPGVIRIRNAGADAFQLRYQEWDYLDGTHLGERVHYLVAEAGSSTLGGLKVEAGTLKTNKVVNDGFRWVGLTQPFGLPPALFTSVMTHTGAQAVTTRTQNLGANGFSIAMQEQESLSDGHGTETLGWIAIEKGTGTSKDERRFEVTDTSTSHNTTLLSYSQSFRRRFVTVLGDMSTTNGIDPATVGVASESANDTEFFIREEQSLNAEINHYFEGISVFAAE